MLTEYLLRASLSCLIAASLYLLFAFGVSRFWNRQVSRDVTRHDVVLGVTSVLFGSPVLQLFAYLHQTRHITRMYLRISEHGWAWWILSIPLYLVCWDLVFYLTHRVLHWNYVFRKSHFRHHACRPPVPWSGIAIDPFETILSGIMPYVVPLFFFPFQIYTVYALNIALMLWATFLHSSINWNGNAILIGTRDHNLHHFFGLRNANYAAIFSFWDRLAGTLDRQHVPTWWGQAGDRWVPRVGRLATAAAPGLATVERSGATGRAVEPSP